MISGFGGLSAFGMIPRSAHICTTCRSSNYISIDSNGIYCANCRFQYRFHTVIPTSKKPHYKWSWKLNKAVRV